jgi:hypothetical protein
MGDNQASIPPQQQQQQQQPPGLDLGAIFKTVQVLTQKVKSDLQPAGEEEGEQQKPPDIARVFSSIGKILGEPSKEMNDVKNTISNLGKAAAGGGPPGPDGAGGPVFADGGFNFSQIFSALVKPPQSHNVQATHQDTIATPPEKPLSPVTEKTVVLEVTEKELNEEVVKKFTINLAENGQSDDVFALELQLEKTKYFYKFFLKERNINLSFLLDIK